MRKRKDDHQSKSPRNEKDDRTGQGIKTVINIFHVFKNTKKCKHDKRFFQKYIKKKEIKHLDIKNITL